MRPVMLAAVTAVMITLACQGLQADSRVRVYADLDRPVIMAGHNQTVTIKVGLAGIGGEWSARRIPLNVSIVLDKSGSMRSDAKMENARRGAIELVRRLEESDVLSLVVYDTVPRLVIPAQHVRNKQALIETISQICAGGNTALYGGVSYGAAEVRRYLSWEYENRIILLSDGLANVGPSTTEDLAYLGRSLAEEGITVTTIGVGLDYNEDLMTALANESGGNAYFASSARDLPEIFAEEIGEAMTLVARDIRIRVRCAGEVRPVGILGRVGEISGRMMSVVIETLCGKNDRYALFEVEVPAGRGGGRLDVAEIEIEYTDPFTNSRLNEVSRVTVAYDEDQELADQSINKQVVKETALNRMAEAKLQAVKLADIGDHKAACAVIAEGAFQLEKAAEQCDKDEEIMVEMENCRAISGEIEANEGLTKHGRKSLVNQVYTQTTQQAYVPDDRKE
jgi:Ca-activated chloride channel family protein